VYKNDYRLHLQRKKICEAKNDDISTEMLLQELQQQYDQRPFSCRNCDKKFIHASSKCAHEKDCKSKPVLSSCKNIENTKIINTVEGDGNAIITGNNNTIEITTNVFHINPIEYANSSFLTKDLLDKMIALGGKRTNNIEVAMLRTSKLVFCNSGHPENYSVYVPNMKLNDAMTWNGARWERVKLNDAIRAIRCKIYNLLVDHYDSNQSNFQMMTLDEWSRFITRKNKEDPKLFKRVDEDIKTTIKDHTPVIKEFIKNKKIISDPEQFDLGYDFE
jgi:hypothetical protein